MKNLIYAIPLLFMILFSCNTPNDKAWDIYTYAKAKGDQITCIGILHRILAEDPTSNALKDSLARMYFGAQMYRSSYLVTKELIENNSKNREILLIAAESCTQMGAHKESMEYYKEALPDKEKWIGGLYTIATNLYNAKRANDAIAYLEAVIKEPESKKFTLEFASSKDSTQQIPYYAAAINVLGFAFMENGELKKAKSFFTEALKFSPDFALAKNNMSVLNELIKKKETR